jgi:hypothetical protein
MPVTPASAPPETDRRTRRSDVDFSRFFAFVDVDEPAQVAETPDQQPADMANMDPSPQNAPAGTMTVAHPTLAHSAVSLSSESIDLTRPEDGDVSAAGPSPPRKRTYGRPSWLTMLTLEEGQRTSAAQPIARTTASWQSVCGTLSGIKGDLSSLADRRGTYAKRVNTCAKELEACSMLFQDCLQPVLRRLVDVVASLQEEQRIAKAALESLGGSTCHICLEGGDCYSVCHPCGHGYFHDACLRAHRARDTRCPVCRRQFVSFRVFPM